MLNVLLAVTDAVPQRGIFIPAIMSAGLLFSILTVLRDAVRGRRHVGRERRIAIAAAGAAHHVVTGRPPQEVLPSALRPRVTYFVIAVSGLGAAVYLAVGATVNYLAPGGYVSEIAWLLAVSTVTAALLAAVGTFAGIFFFGSRPLPAWATEVLVATPLGQVPGTDARRSSRRFLLGWAATGSALAFGFVTIGVGASRATFEGLDDSVASSVASWGWLDTFAWADWLGRTDVAMALALVVGVATLRCVPFAAVYLGSVLATLGVDTLVKALVERPRPPGTALAALEDSYPSGHLAQIVLIAGLLPLALRVLTGFRWPGVVTGTVLTVAVVFTALLRIDDGLHWPTDVLGGALLGAVAVFCDRWLLATRPWHARCHACPWTPNEARPHGAIHLSPQIARLLQRAANAWAFLALVAFTVLAATRGIPEDPEGDPLGVQVEVPATLAALGILWLAWLVSLRFRAGGAVAFALGGLVLGFLASVAYHPAVTVAVAVVFIVPAVALWLSWQHTQSRRAITVVAAVTVASLIGVYTAGASVYDRFFGPAHPQSDTAALPVDHVEWAWSGALETDGFTVHADIGRGEQARLVVTDAGGAVAATSPAVDIPESGIVRLAVQGLAPGTEYAYQIEVDGEPDDARGRGHAGTAAAEPSDVRIAVASCARTGSNGQVYDAIRAADPDLFVIDGDFHYGNPDAADPDLFRRLYHLTLTEPAQAALYREVPVAYVWDDHDFGPNDADSSSPTRDVAREVYRQVVPSHVAPTGTINQAFTLGRVRVVMTDTRSARTDDTMLGGAQLEWFLDELRRSAPTHALVAWVNPDPWIAPDDPSRDDWGAYAGERARILDEVHDLGIDNLVILSGDAHMVAIDDGTNSGGIPVLQAAALDRPGNVKGGPYSEGAFPGAGQFGILQVHDDGGDEIEVELSGRNWEHEVLVRYRFAVEVPDAAR